MPTALADSHADTERTARKEKLNKQKLNRQEERIRLEAAHAATIGRERCAGDPRPRRQRSLHTVATLARARTHSRTHARRQAGHQRRFHNLCVK